MKKIRTSHKSNIHTLFDNILEKQYYDKVKHIQGVRRNIVYHKQTINDDLIVCYQFIKRIEERKRNLSSQELFIELPDIFESLFRRNSLNPDLSGVDQLKIMYERLHILCEALNYTTVDLSEYYEYRHNM